MGTMLNNLTVFIGEDGSSPRSLIALEPARRRFRIGGRQVGRVAALAGFEYERDSPCWAADEAGVIRKFAAGVPVMHRRGLLIERASTRYDTAENAKPVNTTGFTTSLNSAGTAGQNATFTLVDQSSALAASPDYAGLLADGEISGTVYCLDNRLGELVATVSLPGTAPADMAGQAVAWSAVMWGEGFAKLRTVSTNNDAFRVPAEPARMWRTITLGGSETAGRGRIQANPGAIIYFILAQFEAGLAPTTHILGAGGSRAEVIAKITGLSRYIGSAPVHVDVAVELRDGPDGTKRVLASLSDGTSGEAVILSRNASNKAQVEVVTGGVAASDQGDEDITSARRFRVVGRAMSDTLQLGYDITIQDPAAATFPEGLDVLHLGTNPAGGEALEGWLRAAYVGPTSYTPVPNPPGYYSLLGADGLLPDLIPFMGENWRPQGGAVWQTGKPHSIKLSSRGEKVRFELIDSETDRREADGLQVRRVEFISTWIVPVRYAPGDPLPPAVKGGMDVNIHTPSGLDRFTTETTGFSFHQTHSRADDDDLYGRPIFNLRIGAALNLRITIAYATANPITLASQITEVEVFNAPYDGFDQWVRYAYEFVADPYGSGYLKIWKDGVQIVNYTGAMAYVDLLGPYEKIGIYAPYGTGDGSVIEYANWIPYTTDEDLDIAAFATATPVIPND